MSLIPILLAMLCQLLMVAGQLLLKHAMTGQKAAADETRETNWLWYFAGGILLLSLWFFTWVGLMSKWDLSKLYPFEGLNPVLMSIAAWIIFKEKMPVGAWVGLILVGAGIALVASS